MKTKSPVLFSLESTLGPLEQTVMDCMWDLRIARVRDVHEKLKVTKPLAYTTVMTVMDNLHRKGFVSRVKNGKTYIYNAIAPERHVENTSITRAMSSLLPKRFIAYGIGLALAGLVLFYALVALYEDIRYSGVVEFVRLFFSEPQLAGYALWESLPIASIVVFGLLILLIGYLVHEIMTYRARRVAV